MPFGFESLINEYKKEIQIGDKPICISLVRHEGLEPPTFARPKPNKRKALKYKDKTAKSLENQGSTVCVVVRLF
jgi:hypothetical protein